MGINTRYILDAHGNPVEEPDILKWSEWFEKTDRHIADDMVGEIRVSTVFLGTDHSFLDTETPVLYETMIFGGAHDQYQERYTNKVAALAGHDRAFAFVRDSVV